MKKEAPQPDTASPNCLECNRPVPKARSGCDGRQEGRERSYYDLHCNLNNTLFHFLFKSFFNSVLLPRAGVWHCRKRLSLGSGTDVKSLATFSSGPDPSERPRRNPRRNAAVKDSASAAPVSSPPAESPS